MQKKSGLKRERNGGGHDALFAGVAEAIGPGTDAEPLRGYRRGERRLSRGGSPTPLTLWTERLT